MKVAAIFVLYKPNINSFYRTLDSLKNQVNEFVIVVNANEQYDFSKYQSTKQIVLGDNYGIAYAQNRGIEYAVENNDYVILSDQDTIYPNNYVEKFLPFIERELAEVYCPVFFDEIKNIYSPIMVKKFKAIYKYDKNVYVAHAIASGTMIKSSVFDNVGLMDESLFIDYVDFQWCWRAVAQKMRILTIPSIVIKHQLGEGVKKIGIWKVTLRSDFRYFYIVRNGFYLSRNCNYLNANEKLHLLFRTLKFCIGILLLKHSINGLNLCRRAYLDAKKLRVQRYMSQGFINEKD